MPAGRPDLMANVIICSGAEVDYTESLTWYAERSVDATNDFDAEFDRALVQIAADSVRFPLCDARHRYFLLRRFPFRIIYCAAPVNIPSIDQRSPNSGPRLRELNVFCVAPTNDHSSLNITLGSVSISGLQQLQWETIYRFHQLAAVPRPHSSPAPPQTFPLAGFPRRRSVPRTL